MKPFTTEPFEVRTCRGLLAVRRCDGDSSTDRGEGSPGNGFRRTDGVMETAIGV